MSDSVLIGSGAAVFLGYFNDGARAQRRRNACRTPRKRGPTTAPHERPRTARHRAGGRFACDHAVGFVGEAPRNRSHRQRCATRRGQRDPRVLVSFLYAAPWSRRECHPGLVAGGSDRSPSDGPVALQGGTGRYQRRTVRFGSWPSVGHEPKPDHRTAAASARPVDHSPRLRARVALGLSLPMQSFRTLCHSPLGLQVGVCTRRSVNPESSLSSFQHLANIPEAA